MGMKRTIMLGLLVAAMAPAQAQASPWLPIPTAHEKAQNFVWYVDESVNDGGYQTTDITGCYRVGRSTVNCMGKIDGVDPYGYNFTCHTTYRVTWYYSGRYWKVNLLYSMTTCHTELY